MKDKTLQIEALIFSSQEPIGAKEIRNVLREMTDEKITTKDVESSIAEVTQKYQSPEYAIQIKEISDGYIFMSKSEFHDGIGILLKQNSKKKLSKAALETLSIIAYKQNSTKSDIEQIRGVNCDYTVQKLLEKELVTITGRAETPGRPLLYGTSAKFMDYFGLKNLNELPKLKEFEQEENQVGEQSEVVIDPS